MPWAINPVFEPKSTTEPVVDVEAAQADGRNADGGGSPVPDSKYMPPSDHFTLHQIFYIFIIDGIGAAIVAGAINFAIAYALYGLIKNIDQSPVRLFQLPNTLAGDTAVTIFIQFLTTWIAESIIVNRDLKRGGVQPIGFIPEPKWRLLRWFMFLDRKEETYNVRSVKHWLSYFFSQITRSFILAALAFPFIFGVSVGILTALGEREIGDWDWSYPSKWIPEIFKAVQGAVLGLLFTPLMAIFWLSKCGWALKTMERQPGTE
ncbi:hypothetical protein GGR58DRAFT_139303 [Xylaria digitata]|nr:hypothetical protein GGR58DRAFT_139303 [Xylaria digitata]